jgi:hypothetical protein
VTANVSSSASDCGLLPLPTNVPIVIASIAAAPGTGNIPSDVQVKYNIRYASGTAAENVSLYDIPLEPKAGTGLLTNLDLFVRAQTNVNTGPIGVLNGLSVCWVNPFSPFNTGVNLVINGTYA